MTARVGVGPGDIGAVDPVRGMGMTAGELCNRVVVVTHPDSGVVDAARAMREKHVGCLVVVDRPAKAGGVPHVRGVITDRDIVTAIVAEGLDPAALRVEDVMSPGVVCAREGESFADLLGRLRQAGVRRLPVTAADGTLIGLVTLDDLLEHLAEQMRNVVLAIASEQRRERRERVSHR